MPIPLVRCGGCGEPPTDAVRRPLRRGRCDRCYDAWVRARPIGQGASCAACDDRRESHLRHFELGLRQNAVGGRWIVLCFNCVAVAESLNPPPRSVEGLKMRLYRDRRWGDRRAESVGRGTAREPSMNRRDPVEKDRRDPLRHLFDASDLVEELVEMEAEFEQISEAQLAEIGEVTGIHAKLSD